ncbi:DnaJ protein ERDJ3B [Cardamine amara subsp. amara]|uniref:DnaJ protein ERDJ3B n=1 Tax=Cardamine amara subsp. amara TaxID=228776 RepID=A0ABD0ZAC0_CARAN
MARKGSHQKNGLDNNQTKQRKKTSDSLLSSKKGQGKAGEAESVLKENCLDDNKQSSSPVCETLERDTDAVKGTIDQPVASENDLGGDGPLNEPGLTTEETRYIPFGREHINGVMRSLLNILSTNSPSENIELAYNAVLRKMRISTGTISREVTRLIEKHRPLIVSVKSRVYKSRDFVLTKVGKVYPVVFRWLMHFGSIILLLSLVWLDCAIRGFDSFIRMGTASFFSIMWCGLFSAFSMIGMTKFIMLSVATVLVSLFIGFVVGSVTLAISGLVLLWLYGSFWTTLLFLFFGGLAFLIKHERIALFIITVYSVYSAWSYVGWLGVVLAFNLAFISTDALIYFFKNKVNQQSTADGSTDPLNGSSYENGPGFPGDRGLGVASTSGTDSELTSEDEVARLLNCADHYSALGVPRYGNVDVAVLKREYRKKAMLVHPDKNMGNEKAAEAFKKLQNAYEVLLDSIKRKSYDDELKREELLNYFKRFQNSSSKGHGFSGSEGEGEEAFRECKQIACKKCGNLHAWFLTKKSKSRARWCQDCKEFHQAKDGDGWVEQSSQHVLFGLIQKVDMPRAYVCADSKIYEASQWYICQGMRCPANTHKPSFHVNTNVTGAKRGTSGSSSGQRGNQKMPNATNPDETMTEEEIYEWLQNAVQAGMFDNVSVSPSSATASSSSSSKKKKKGKKQW